MKKYLFSLLMTLLFVTPCFAKVNAVTTLPWIGSIAKEIGKDKVNITTLIKSTQDPHYVEAKPSMILAVSRADILMFNGLDLEIGYLPVLIESSRNPKIRSGMPGNVDCSQFVEVIDRPVKVDRSMGDVHPFGNPHYHLSPRNIGKVARGIAEVFSNIDPNNADFYRNNLSNLEKRLSDKELLWRKTDLRGRKFISYHKYFEYLAAEFGFIILGYVEPKPGIPPSASHIQGVIQLIKENNVQNILTTTYYGKREVGFIAEKTGAKVTILPHDVGSMEGIDDWFKLIETILSRLMEV
jgi:zinc/manganese transport system substrate-binding protein